MGVRTGSSGGVRRVTAKVVIGGVLAAVASAGLVVGTGVRTVGADSPNPTSGTGTATIENHPQTGQPAIKVVLRGTWDWKRGNWCFNDRWAAGWAIDWNDPNQPGHVVDTLNGVTYDVGVQATPGGLNAAYNTVDFYNDARRCGTRPAGSDRDVGNWGFTQAGDPAQGVTHWYPLGTQNISPCAVMYDIHEDKNSFKVEDLVAGGNKHNSDNSIEKNSADVNICFPITVNQNPTLTLEKVMDNAGGGKATANDFTLTATGPTTISGKSGTGDVTNKSVQPGAYTLSETNVAGYTGSAWSCVGGAAVNGNQITLQNNQNVKCTITNKANPVDLKLEKSDGGATPLAGGSAFDYTLTVDNVGGRDVDANEPVTVTDKLPAGFEYQSATGSCTVSGNAAAGQTVTCDVPPADLQVADPPVVITISVKVLPGTPPGNYENKGYVTTEDDPPCVGAGCVPPCPPQNNNVDCEPTDLTGQAALTVTKGDNDVTVKPGDSYDYTITVRNNGPSAVTNVTLTDALPSGLSLVSATGANWSCNSSTNLSCTYGPGLSVGQTTTSLTVRVTVAASYTQTEVLNVAVATATVQPGQTVNAQDDERTPVTISTPGVPGIKVVKKVNGFDANDAPGLIVAAGTMLTFTYEVSNTGGTALSNVTVVDDKGLTVACPSTTLAVGASMVCTAVGPAPASGQYTNVGTTTGTPPTGPPVTSTDRANAFVSTPAVDITKFVNGADANTPPGLSVVTGTTVTWTYRVENTGNVDLTLITVTDDKGVAVNCGSGSNGIARLKPGEVVTCSASGTAITGLYTNIGTASGTPSPPLLPGQSPLSTTPVTDSDSASYTGAPAPVVLPPEPTIPGPELPPTGADTGWMVAIAAGLVAIGAALVRLGWRRRRHASA